MPKDAWRDWCQFRRGGKGKWTRKAQELSLRTLDRLRADGHEPRTVIEQSIERGWSGLFPVKAGDTRAGPQGQQRRPSAADDFRGKTYVGTAPEDLPPEFRDLAGNG